MTRALKNDRFLRALKRQPVDRTPVWIMRQAGRYLPEYRAIRSRVKDFMALCRNTELACEVTLQPLQRFPLDAAILFSDILTIPDAMGLGLRFVEGQGPVFDRPIRTPSDIYKLAIPDMEDDLRYVMDAVRMIRRELDGDVPLIGFSGSPWTLATYMLEGQSSKDFAKSKAFLYQHPAASHQLLDLLADSVTAYLQAQIDAGAQALQIFDTWGGILAHPQFSAFSLAYIKKIITNLRQNSNNTDIPIIVFTKGGGIWLEALADSGCDALGIDWTVHLGDARQRVGQHVALQGNLDPAVLYAQPETIESEVQRVLEEYGSGSGHIFNLGHGITPGVNPDNLSALIKALHALSPAYHSSSG